MFWITFMIYLALCIKKSKSMNIINPELCKIDSNEVINQFVNNVYAPILAFRICVWSRYKDTESKELELATLFVRLFYINFQFFTF